jgi:hypothetical protein
LLRKNTLNRQEYTWPKSILFFPEKYCLSFNACYIPLSNNEDTGVGPGSINHLIILK